MRCSLDASGSLTMLKRQELCQLDCFTSAFSKSEVFWFGMVQIDFGTVYSLKLISGWYLSARWNSAGVDKDQEQKSNLRNLKEIFFGNSPQEQATVKDTQVVDCHDRSTYLGIHLTCDRWVHVILKLL